ncbi:hypothetical protein C0Z18_09925 [Trinickia dabaoshanensis]|uniref:Uncharacterized protein n=1 Tax=Trinickia dabaoshanensis TaxID=564714 RepID=A0A2N7VUN4_9BURK|nr:hypothetical protein C0Z18_09925 [Trinickia dabaoshanensis]
MVAIVCGGTRQIDYLRGQANVNTADMIAAILRSYESPAEIAAAFAAFWRYQLAGLQALMAGMNRSSAWPMPPIN